jgi:hypothetical protein
LKTCTFKFRRQTFQIPIKIIMKTDQYKNSKKQLTMKILTPESHTLANQFSLTPMKNLETPIFSAQLRLNPFQTSLTSLP